MTRITSRFVMLIASAAVAPLMIYGLVSINRLREGTQLSVNQGNLRIAQQVAARLALYVDNNARVLRSIGQELIGTRLDDWQQAHILRNHVLEFPEFREITLFDSSGRVVASSKIGGPETKVIQPASPRRQGVDVSPIFTDEDGLPATDLSLALGGAAEVNGWLVGRLSLEELWRFVDEVTVGQRGFALVVANGRLVAHGNPQEKRSIALPADAARTLPAVALVAEHGSEATFTDQFVDGDERKLAAVARIVELDWTVLVEQPIAEAYGIANEIQRQLFVAIAVALLGTIVFGWIWGRSFITRIFALMRATQAIAAGRLNERVAVSGNDEIRQLGDSFNAMADRLVELQDDVRKQERQAMFGRIAAGLVHDLSHPIQNVSNSCKLIVKMFDDMEYRETFRQTVDREMAIVKRVLDDLRNLARPIPLERITVDVNRSLAEAVSSMQGHAETAGVTLRTELSHESVFIEGDVFALGRVYRNLLLNAIQATAPGGMIVAESEARGDRVQVRVRDTGCGIPPERLTAIFEDFVTTKHRGLGLGLAIARKIVDQLGGRIDVTSDVGRGTTFVLDFPRTRARPMLVAG